MTIRIKFAVFLNNKLCVKQWFGFRTSGVILHPFHTFLSEVQISILLHSNLRVRKFFIGIDKMQQLFVSTVCSIFCSTNFYSKKHLLHKPITIKIVWLRN